MTDPQGRRIKGIDLLHDPARNKGTAFTREERDALGLRGLLPPRVFAQQEQVSRVLENFRKKSDDLERYIFLSALQDRNETLFYRLIVDHIEEMMPVIYTPTVGQACQQYGQIFRRSRGLYVSAEDRGRVSEVLANWPEEDVRVIVVTDGERILGLGDLGAHGMGIPVGKLALYTACAGIPPSQCLPVTIDVGTDNQQLLEDELYIGLRQPRMRGADYDELLEEFIHAVSSRFPDVLLQFEDFAHGNAFRLLQKYRDSLCTFNDDIQGTAGVVLAGLYSAMRIAGGGLHDQTVLFAGAGAAGIGMADLQVAALMGEGMGRDEAVRHCWFVDSRGLVVRGREGLEEHKISYAHDHEPVGDLLGAVRALRPTALIGATGRAGMFTREILEAMGRQQDRPIVFALSNPTSKAECTAEQAYGATQGRAIFASGSPFDPVEVEGRTLVPGQANNAYVFPGLGLGVMASRARRVTEEMFLAAARALADQVSAEDLEVGRIFPPLSQIRSVSAAIAEEVAGLAHKAGLAGDEPPQDLAAHIRSRIYEPDYPSCV
jgi:malate dehydrogenase (oxaloacetate-decarboxylating)(NADP+)